MVSLLYLKHAFNLSDEALVERWSENVVWQYFSGQAYYEPKLPCDATQIGRMLEIARGKVTAAAKRVGIALKQTFVHEGAKL